MNVSITKHQEVYIRAMLKHGGFANVSEIIRDALRVHQAQWEQHYVVEGLEQKLAEGADTPRKPFKPGCFNHLKRPRRAAKAA